MRRQAILQVADSFSAALRTSVRGLPHAAICVALLLTGCGGGGHSGSSSSSSIAGAAIVPAVAATVTETSPPDTIAAASHAPVPVTFQFALPSTSTQSGLRRKQDASYSGGYVSPAYTPTISLTVTPLGGTAAGPYAGTCTTGTSGNCTVTFTAAPGPTTFAGTISENGNVVSRFSQMQIVQPGTASTIAFTANPVVASVTLQLASTTVSGGAPQDVLLTVLAKDANNNTIAGSLPFVDSAGNQVALSLGTSSNTAGGRGSVQLRGPIRIIKPQSVATFIHYDGQWMGSAVASVTPSSGLVSVAGPAVLTVVPAQKVISSCTGCSAGAIALGPDNSSWFTDGNTNQIGRVTSAGQTSYFPIPTASAGPSSIAVGSDGALWFTESSASKIGRISLSGSITEYVTPTASAIPQWITSGQDGNLYFTENNASGAIGRISTTGKITEISTNPYNYPFRLASGRDGNIWFTAACYCVGRLSPAGKIDYLSLPSAPGRSVFVATTPDGTTWVTSGSSLYQISQQGAVSLAPITGSPNATFDLGIGVGPDGALWSWQTNYYWIRIATDGSFVPYYIAANRPANAILGPDGNFWYVGRYSATVNAMVL